MPSSPLTSPRRRWAFASAISVAAVAGVIAVSGASPAALAADVRQTGMGAFAVVAFGWLVLLAAQTLRWRALLAPIALRPFGEVYLLRVVGQLFNAFLPARAGDLLRFELLFRRSGVPRATLVGMEVVDQTLDKMGWLPAFAIVAALGRPPAWMLRIVPFALVLPVVVVLTVISIRRIPRPPTWLASLRRGLDAHRLSTLLFVALVLGPLPWLVETAVIGLAARSAGLHVDPIQAFAMLTALNVAYAVPVPSNAGTAETALGGTLVAMGYPADVGLAFGLVYHLGQLVPALLVGVPGFFALRSGAPAPQTVTQA